MQLTSTDLAGSVMSLTMLYNTKPPGLLWKQYKIQSQSRKYAVSSFALNWAFLCNSDWHRIDINSIKSLVSLVFFSKQFKCVYLTSTGKHNTHFTNCLLLYMHPSLQVLLIFFMMFSRNLYSPGYLCSSALPDWFWPQSFAIMLVSEMQLLRFLPFLFHNKVSISAGTRILICPTWEKIITFFCYPNFEIWLLLY